MNSLLRLSRPWRLIIVSAWLTASLASVALAGGGPENVCVVVNSRSWASQAIANEYVHLRQIPSNNVVYLDAPQIDSIDVAAFRNEILVPILKTLEERGVANQIDYIAYSSDFPTAIDLQPDVENIDLPRVATPTGSINGLTYLYRYVLKSDPSYMRLDINQYMRLPKASATVGTLTRAGRKLLEDAVKLMRDQEWAKAEQRLLDVAKGLPAPHPLIEFHLAGMRARQGRLDEAMASLQRAYDLGWPDVAEVETDEDLESLRERDDFKALVAVMQTPKLDVQPSIAFHALKPWYQGPPNADPTIGDRYLLSTMLAVTSGRGNSFSEAIQSLRTSAGADGTRPDGTVYFMVNGDIRSQTRQAGFRAAAAKLKELGMKAELLDGVLPDHKLDVIGAMIGAADFDWARSGSKLLPGAIAEHLTSFGGVMAERSGQTPLSDLIRAGAAGSSGAVVEPYALQEKFPFSFLHVHYAAGCSLAESFYQAVQGPYQLLIVGDPLCQPFAKAPVVEVSGVAEGEDVRDALTLTAKTSPDRQDAIQRWELFVDGRRRGLADSWASLKWDASREAEGRHELRVVGVEKGLIETQGRAIVNVAVDTHGRKMEVVAPSSESLTWEEPIKLSAKVEHARRITFFHNRRELAAIEGAEGSVEIAPAVLGAGPVRIEIVALVSEPKLARVNVPPVDLVVPLPTVLAAQERPAKLLAGMTAAAGDERIDVSDTYPADWFEKLDFPHDREFSLVGWFESASDEVQQFQINSNLNVKLEIDGRPFTAPDGDGWKLIPFRAAAGAHHFKITGKTADEPRLMVRFGGRGTTSLDGERFSHAASL